MKYTIYTDGACSGNPGSGGWGAVIFDNNNKQKNISGSEKNTTNLSLIHISEPTRRS